MASIWSQEGNTYTESNGGASRTYGSNNNDMTNTAVGNINKTPGLGLTHYGSDGTPYGDYDAKYATYLKLFSGEMIKAYESQCIAKGTVQTRTLRNGKSLQFIYTGRITADYHQPGTPILASGDPPVAEKIIVMDDLLVSSAFLYDLDETLAHYSLRSEISAKIGHALAEAYDKKIFRVIAKSCLLYTSPSPRDRQKSRMPSSA